MTSVHVHWGSAGRGERGEGGAGGRRERHRSCINQTTDLQQQQIGEREEGESVGTQNNELRVGRG